MRKKISQSMLLILLLPATLFGGGIVTNTNQSASFIRMPALDAIIGIEGVYYNPAGLIHLGDGFHISLSNQYITQSRVVTSTFPGMNTDEFKGDVLAPIFPTFYAVYKKNKFAYSLGVNPIGGGGSANFEMGLPSFEQQVAILPPLLTASGISTSQYSLNSAFDGSSLNWGFQFNASYAINDMISVSLGLRYIVANNSYTGYLKELMINPLHPLNPEGAGNMVSAPLFFTTLATAANGAATSIQPVIDADGGGFTLDQLVGAGYITQAQADQLSAGLGASYNPEMTASQVQTAYLTNAGIMSGYATLTSDKELDASQSGSGIAPIIGLNLKFSDNLNVALKYEHKAEITITNKTLIDDVGLYPDGDNNPNDMPSMLSVGVGFKPIDKLTISGGVHYYFDKSANYGKKLAGVFVENSEVIDKNFFEAGFGLEYKITDKILASAGYLLTQTGVNDKYHSDLSHSLNTNSIGVGGKYFLNENIGINLGFMTTMYKGYTKMFTGYEETYNRKAMVIAFGIDYKF